MRSARAGRRSRHLPSDRLITPQLGSGEGMPVRARLADPPLSGGRIMHGSPSLAVALAPAGLGFGTTAQLSAQENAPAADRQLLAGIVRDAVLPEAAKVKIEAQSADRHREVL